MDKTNPDYYKKGKREVIELTEHLDFCLGNAVKYVLRAPYKEDEMLDLRKALWYVRRAKTHGKREPFPALNPAVVHEFKNDIVTAIVEQDFDKAIRLIEEKIKETMLNEALARVQVLENEIRSARFAGADLLFRGWY